MNQNLYFKQNERSEQADLLKGLAVIFMILVHISEKFLNHYYYSEGIVRLFFFLGASPAAPIFMIVMGYFITQGKSDRKKMTIRGLKLISIGVLLNIALNFHLIIRILNNEFPTLNIWEYVFGVDILFLAGLSTLVLAFIKFSPHPKIIAFISFLFFILILNFNENMFAYNGEYKYLLAFFLAVSDWSYFPFIPWFIYPLLGFIIGQNKKLLKYFKPTLTWRIILILSFIVFFTLTMDYSFGIANDLPVYYNHGIKFFGYNLLFLSGWWLIIKQFNYYQGTNKILVYLRWVGKNVTLFYIVQWIIIGNVATAVYQSLNLYYSLASFVIITILVSFIVYYLQDKIKGIRI